VGDLQHRFFEGKRVGQIRCCDFDYSVNDNNKLYDQESFTDLMGLLIDLEKRPAVIALETFSNLVGPLPECKDFSMKE